MKNIGFIILIFFCAYIIAYSIKSILIGTGKHNDPRYDTQTKRNQLKRSGFVGLIVSSVGLLFFLYITIVIYIGPPEKTLTLYI
jgi:uncharacterized membrane protein